MSDETIELTPAMAVLSPRRRLFVQAMLDYPGISAAEAARRAGYSDHLGAERVQGHRAAHDAGVQAAIREQAGLRLGSSSLIAADVLIAIAQDEEAPRKDRMKAAVYLLDRTGFGAVQTFNVNKTVVDHTTKGIEERIARAMERLARLGDNGKGAPEALPAPLEGEFSEVGEKE